MLEKGGQWLPLLEKVWSVVTKKFHTLTIIDRLYINDIISYSVYNISYIIYIQVICTVHYYTNMYSRGNCSSYWFFVSSECF